MAEFEEKLNSILGNETAMGQIMSLAQSLSGGGDTPTDTPYVEDVQSVSDEGDGMPDFDIFSMLGDIDPRMIQLGIRLFQEYQGGNNQSATLLDALRPFIRAERQEQLDKAIQWARISKLARIVLESMREGREVADV